MVATSALVQESSPTLKFSPTWHWEITSAERTAILTYAANVAANFAGVLTSAVPTRISRGAGAGGAGRAGQGGNALGVCRGPSEPAVEGRHVLPDVGDRRGLRRSRFGLFRQCHRDAAAVDPAIKQRLDAVGDPELPGCVTRQGAEALS